MRPLRRAVLTAVAGAAVMLLLQALPDAAALEYRRDLLLTQPWRLISGHAVHVNLAHALVNGLAWILLARLFARQLGAARQLLCLLAATVGISIALAAWYPAIAWYRGASGALHALFFAGATVELASALRLRRSSEALWSAALLVGGSIKVAVELPRGPEMPYAQWLDASVVPQAHLIGAVIGVLLGLAIAARERVGARISR